MNTLDARDTRSEDVRIIALKRRLDGIGWALFLIMIGGLWLMPEGTVPQGTWLIGVGLIMLGVTAVGSLYGIKVNWFTVGLGIIALSSGVSGFFGVRLPWFPILLVLIGTSIILEQVLAPDL